MIRVGLDGAAAIAAREGGDAAATDEFLLLLKTDGTLTEAPE